MLHQDGLRYMCGPSRRPSASASRRLSRRNTVSHGLSPRPGTAFTPGSHKAGKGSIVAFEQLRLQIEPSPVRRHFAAATLLVRCYLDHAVGPFYGLRCIARFKPDGAAGITESKATGALTPERIFDPGGTVRSKKRTKRPIDMLRTLDHLVCSRQPCDTGEIG